MAKSSRNGTARHETIAPSGWDRKRLHSLLHSIAGRKVLVVGDVGVDRYTEGLVERISPEAPVPIVKVTEEKLKLGLAANVADNVMALGGRAFLVGVVGRDRTGEDFRALARKAGIPPSHLVTDPSRRTVLKERVVSDRQQLIRIDYEVDGELGPRAKAGLLRAVRAVIPKVDAVIVEDYSKGLLSGDLLRDIFAAARRAGKPALVDPHMRTPVAHYRGAYALTPNKKEAEALAGMSIDGENALARAGRLILSRTGAEHVVITLGRDGMAIFSKGSGGYRAIPTAAREVYDVSGAGDTVIATLALCVAAGAAIEEAAVLGNVAAGVEVGKRGTATVSPDEVLVALELQ